MNKILLTIIFSMLFSMVAQAQEMSDFSESELQTVPTKEYKKVNVKFGDEMVKGKSETPDADFLFQKGDFNFKRLIRIRENFIPEVQQGKDDMRGL